MKKIFVLAQFLFFFNYLFSQNAAQMDSLERLLPQLANGDKMEMLNKLAVYHCQEIGRAHV